VTNAALAEKMLHALLGDMEFFWANAHPDLVLEFPYGGSLGSATRVTERAQAEAFLNGVATIVPGLKFSEVRVMPLADSDGVVLEYRGLCPAVNNYDQQYIALMRFKDGKLILFREYFDTMEVKRALG
jgi:uncharacterized protein